MEKKDPETIKHFIRKRNLDAGVRGLWSEENDVPRAFQSVEGLRIAAGRNTTTSRKEQEHK